MSSLRHLLAAKSVESRSQISVLALLAVVPLLAGCVGSSDDARTGVGADAVALSSNAGGSGRVDFVSSTRRGVENAGAHYRVGPLDVLKIKVFQVEDLSRDVQVSGSGTITLPLIGEVPANNRTPQQIEFDIANRLRAKYLQSPQVTVFVDQYNSQKVTVGGAVKKPGIYPLKGDMTLMQAIAVAEGTDVYADTSSVAVSGLDRGARQVSHFSLDQIQGGAVQDPILRNGDVVTVERSGLRSLLHDISPAITAVGATAGYAGLLVK